MTPDINQEQERLAQEYLLAMKSEQTERLQQIAVRLMALDVEHDTHILASLIEGSYQRTDNP